MSAVRNSRWFALVGGGAALLLVVGCASILGDFGVGSTAGADAGQEAGAIDATVAGEDASVDAGDASVPSEAQAAPDTGTPDFALTLAPGAGGVASAARVVRGLTTPVVLDLTSKGGFSGAVVISVTGLSAGVTADALTIGAGVATGTLTIRASSTSPSAPSR